MREGLIMNFMELAWKLLPIETWLTLYMVFASAFFATLLGLPVGIILSITGKGGLKENPFLSQTLGGIVNIGRSFPFAILMIALIPVTRWIVGTSLGTTAAIVPLSLAAAPFIARVIESALNDVDKNIIEAAQIMGSSTWQIITKVLMMEALPSIVSGITLTTIHLVGYSAMAGLIGGGGLGKVAIQYGYNRFNLPIMAATIIILIVMVQIIQYCGNHLVKKIDVKRGKIR